MYYNHFASSSISSFLTLRCGKSCKKKLNMMKTSFSFFYFGLCVSNLTSKYELYYIYYDFGIRPAQQRLIWRID